MKGETGNLGERFTSNCYCLGSLLYPRMWSIHGSRARLWSEPPSPNPIKPRHTSKLLEITLPDIAGLQVSRLPQWKGIPVLWQKILKRPVSDLLSPWGNIKLFTLLMFTKYVCSNWFPWVELRGGLCTWSEDPKPWQYQCQHLPQVQGRADLWHSSSISRCLKIPQSCWVSFKQGKERGRRHSLGCQEPPATTSNFAAQEEEAMLCFSSLIIEF